MICPFVSKQPLGPTVGGNVPSPNINTPIYAYLPRQFPNGGSRPEPFSPMRILLNTTGIANCPGVVNLQPLTSETDYGNGGLPALLGPSGATATRLVLVRDTQDLSNNYNKPFPNPSGWNQCQAYDINSVPASTPDACNIMKDTGNLGILSVQLQDLIGQSNVNSVWQSYNSGRTVCSTVLPVLPNTGRCNAVIGGPPWKVTNPNGCAVLDPSCTVLSSGNTGAGFVAVLYDPYKGPPAALDFSKVGTDGMSSDLNNQVSSRVLFVTNGGAAAPTVLSWSTRVQLSIRKEYANANDALFNRYTQTLNYEYLWIPAPSTLPYLPGGQLNIEFESKFTTISTDLISITALGAFTAILGFAGTVWGSQQIIKEKIILVTEYLKKRRVAKSETI